MSDLKAFRVWAPGYEEAIVFERTPNAARHHYHLGAREVGYRLDYTDVRARRAGHLDGASLTPRAYSATQEAYLMRLVGAAHGA